MDLKAFAVMTLVIVCGCLSAQNVGQAAGNLSVKYVTKPTLLFRLFDSRVGENASGTLFCQNWSGAKVPPEGAVVVKGDIVPGPCAVGVAHADDVVYLPLEFDDSLIALLNTSDEYSMSFDSGEFDRRFFIFINQDQQALQGVLSLDGRILGIANERGVVAVNYTQLHPGNMSFTWYLEGSTPAEWDIKYIASDMRQLYLRVPVDTEGIGLMPTPPPQGPPATS